ncbi:NADH-quinone oxidoreductase subunit F [Neisseria sp. HMSC075C10]|uniref:complex I 51 kDa subunit family protein n=1 Tax=unclassified Neisseria TaxID=2623750 RepID=UPI0008A4D56C|nr:MULTISPECIES: NADH-ubiquinone oxidoreductase-F iron-sulfur binding region domain-containing protein [unclassified Neisseria]OFO37180.1 NADH-quinone oxidoreductase subunit F [Neisseria sp. HMSC075C10]OHQ57220.1 NADH-quinone oxidoreductase subunit F [Neisseria sp. HMSC070H10]
MNQANQNLLHPSRQVGADLAAWRKVGGGEGLLAALADPQSIVSKLQDANLCGMGGAGFPTWRKWEAAVAAQSKNGDKYVVCNANEDEPGTFKDRVLLAKTPHQVIEGVLIAAVACRANKAILYVNPHQTESIASITPAIEQWKNSDLFIRIENYLGKPLDLQLVETSGRYIGGEETAVISWLEGGFPFPRRKPPFPAESGVAGEPTLINNTETFANIPQILAKGAEWYKSLGLGDAAGTKLYSLSGDVLNPGLYELPMGTTLQSLIFDHGGGMLEGRTFKAVFTGGPSNTLLTVKDLDVPLDFVSVRERKSSLGTGAMIVISEGTSVVRKVAEYVEFFASNSCGQCPPCKGGTFQLSRLLNRVDTGIGTPDDLRALQSLCQLLPRSGRCGLIDGAVTVLQSSLRTFPEEYGLSQEQE